jgi:hypothetical protein
VFEQEAIVSTRSGFCGAAVIIATMLVCHAPGALAQTPRARLSIGQYSALPDSVVPISILIDQLADSVSGFQLSLTLSRPDIMEFRIDTAIQTCYRCADQTCTSVVAYPCTVSIAPIDVSGTLTHDWDYMQAQTFGGFDLRVTGIGDNDFDHLPPPIPPGAGGILVKVLGHVLCEIPDTLQDRTVWITVNSVGSYLANAQGSLILPVDFTSGNLTALPTPRGDLNSDGVIDVLDVVGAIDIAFVGAASPCPQTLPDVNCDGVVDVMDIIYLIDYAFSGGAQPCQ